MKIYTYWETAPGREIPPYILLGLASMRRVFGEDFTILTPSVVQGLGVDPRDKEWGFRYEADERSRTLRAIIAKSDYVRMAAVAQEGGYWLDADTIALRDFRDDLAPMLEEHDFIWHSEQFFGSTPNNEILTTAARNMLNAEWQTWGDPGQVKTLIAEAGSAVPRIPFWLIDPKSEQPYSYATSGVLLEDHPVDKFLCNERQAILKLYNTPFAETEYGVMTPEQFLDSDTLLARVFLSVEPDKDWWGRALTDIRRSLSN